jgi:DNA-binding Lrp family transcriptional regulator
LDTREDEKRAWIMVNSNIAMLSGNPLNTCHEIRKALAEKGIEARANELLGIYDAVVEVEGKSFEDIYQIVRIIMKLPVVAATTTYYSMVKWTRKGELKPPFAYILIGTIARETDAVQKHLTKIDEVQKADIVSGPHDIIAEVATDSIEGIVKVLEKMFTDQTGITRTHTHIVIGKAK